MHIRTRCKRDPIKAGFGRAEYGNLTYLPSPEPQALDLGFQRESKYKPRCHNTNPGNIFRQARRGAEVSIRGGNNQQTY